MAGYRRETRRDWTRWMRWQGSNLADVICRPDKMQRCCYQALALNKNASRSGWHFASGCTQ
ncbi:hypothetical protein IVU49_10900 [Salmonella enterica subsp. enterica serovar Worthington]|nr:hypothetical protein [Salmonella enterica subsp. enterica serovar Worthington]